MITFVRTYLPVGSSLVHAPESAPVAIGPGARQFSRIPYLPHSEANDLKLNFIRDHVSKKIQSPLLYFIDSQ